MKVLEVIGLEDRLSEHNPFDDEEQFTEQSDENALPQEDVIKPDMSRDAIVAHVTKQIDRYFENNRLVEITLAFEFSDAEGYSSWVTTHYIRK